MVFGDVASRACLRACIANNCVTIRPCECHRVISVLTSSNFVINPSLYNHTEQCITTWWQLQRFKRAFSVCSIIFHADFTNVIAACFSRDVLLHLLRYILRPLNWIDSPRWCESISYRCSITSDAFVDTCWLSSFFFLYSYANTGRPALCIVLALKNTQDCHHILWTCMYV